MSNIFATNAPGPPHWTLNSYFGEFRSFWVHLGSFRYYTKLGAIWAETCAISEKSSWHEVVSNTFATNVLGPLHWNLNSRFGEFVVFVCILDRFVTVRNSMQFGLNW